MPSYKLIYSQNKGRAELSRLLFALAGQEYEDVRWTRETIQAEKTNLIFGQVPMLEVDGKQYAQSMAIAGFLAREFGFYGRTSVEQMEVDQVIGIINDIFSVLIKQYFEQDQEKKAAMIKVNIETTFPKFVGFFEKILKNNNTGLCRGQGFHGRTSVEQMEVDQVIGIINDIFNFLINQYFEQDQENKAAILKENDETTIPKFVGFFEKCLKYHKTGFYVGDKLGL